MKVRRSSWHHKVYKLSFDNYNYLTPTNLCPYFWRVVWGMFKILIVVAIVALFTFGIGSIAYQFPFQSLGAVLTLAGIITINYNWYSIKGRFTRDLPEPEGEAPEPGLIRSFLKAKKDKVCPIIELVE